VWQFAEHLPIQDRAHIISLGEGNTPVCDLGHNLFLKLESLNPTGSYKDRFASCAVSWMKSEGKTRCLATSSGNTGAALAAYCARASISCTVFLVETTPEGKTAQMLAHGAKLKRVREFGLSSEVTAGVMERLRRRASSGDAALLISAFAFSPAGMEGVKTIAYELAGQLNEIDDIFIPVGGGGLLTAVFQGFRELFRAARLRKMPRIHAVQPEGCATVTGPLERGESLAASVRCTSGISGLQVPNVIDGQSALEAVRAVGGTGQTVSDSAIFAAQEDLSRRGAYCEPAGAAGYAGYLQALKRGIVTKDNRTVCLITGHGFKDPDSIRRIVAGRAVPSVGADDLFGGENECE